MKDNDSDLLFEAYRKIYEAPVDPGIEWEDDDVAAKFDTGELERLAKYKVPSTDVINDIVVGVKAFLEDHEGSHYPGSYKDFRKEIADVIRDRAGLGSANAGYAARVIQNALRRLNVISVDGATREVEVKEVEPKKVEKAIEKEVDDVVEVQISGTYEISRDSGQTPNSEADKAHEILRKAIGSGFKASGRDIINTLRKDMSLDDAKDITTQLLQSDGIIVPEEEDDSEDRIVDTGDDEIGDDQHAAQDYFDKYMGSPMGSDAMDDY